MVVDSLQRHGRSGERVPPGSDVAIWSGNRLRLPQCAVAAALTGAIVAICDRRKSTAIRACGSNCTDIPSRAVLAYLLNGP